MGRFFERMSRLPLEKVTPMVPLGGAGIGMHVIPVEKAIEMENHQFQLNIFHIGLISMKENMQQVLVRAVAQELHMTRLCR